MQQWLHPAAQAAPGAQAPAVVFFYLSQKVLFCIFTYGTSAAVLAGKSFLVSQSIWYTGQPLSFILLYSEHCRMSRKFESAAKLPLFFGLPGRVRSPERGCFLSRPSGQAASRASGSAAAYAQRSQLQRQPSRKPIRKQLPQRHASRRPAQLPVPVHPASGGMHAACRWKTAAARCWQCRCTGWKAGSLPESPFMPKRGSSTTTPPMRRMESHTL